MRVAHICVVLMMLCLLFVTPVAGGSSFTIDFAELTTPSNQQYSTVDSKGFHFADSKVTDSGIGFTVWATGLSYNGDPDGATLTQTLGLSKYGVPSIVTMTSIGGQTFDVFSIDLGDGYNSDPFTNFNTTEKVTVTGTHPDGSTAEQVFWLDNNAGLQTGLLSSDFTDLNSLSWYSNTKCLQTPVSTWGCWVQFDNINVAFHQPTVGAPEPGTCALLMAGLGLLPFAVRRRR